MATSGFDPFPKRPLVPTEALRIGAALLPYGLPYGETFPSSEIWIVMETDVPHRLVGVRGSYDDAMSLLSSRSGGLPPADLYGPYAPPPPSALQTTLDQSDPSVHDNTYACRLVGRGVPDTRELHRRHADMRSITLTIEWTPEAGKPDSVTYDIAPHTDTIFLTRASREAFMYPRYSTIFGPEYVQRMRADLGEG